MFDEFFRAKADNHDFHGQKMGNYHMTELIGRGGFGRVYLAKHIYLNTQVALKVLHGYDGWKQPELIESLRKEAYILSRLKHPNIIQFIEFGTEDSIPYLVMSYATKGTIRSQYPHGTQLPVASVIAYVKQLASALHYIHEQGLIYNAIKPENILVGGNDELLLGDFGETVPVPSDDERILVGTPAYMAPEQLEGVLSQSSDLYALGTVVYEWLSGSLPFSRPVSDLIKEKKTRPPHLLRKRSPSIPPMVETVVMKALDPDPMKRFENVMAFANALEHSIPANPLDDEPNGPSPSTTSDKKSTSASGIEIFICYAREDEVLLKGLEKHLSALKRQGLINVWHDRNINAGTEWEQEIMKHLNSAQIILFLVSSDFMDSDYCYGTEMKRAMERHERGETCVIPIILRPVFWTKAPFSKLQVLPRDAKPIFSSHWHNLDEAFFDVVDGIQKVIETLNE